MGMQSGAIASLGFRDFIIKFISFVLVENQIELLS